MRQVVPKILARPRYTSISFKSGEFLARMQVNIPFLQRNVHRKIPSRIRSFKVVNSRKIILNSSTAIALIRLRTPP